MIKVPFKAVPFSHQFSCALGQRRCKPCLHVPRLMTSPARVHTGTTSSNRKSLKVAVAINLLGGVFVKEITGTKYDGCEGVKPYLIRVGKTCNFRPAAKLGAEEYVEFLKDAVQHFKDKLNTRRYTPSFMLVHDRDKTHSSHFVTTWLESEGMAAELSPPRSPDLMPLDYSVFGTCKTKLMKDLPRSSPFTQQVMRLLELLRGFDTKATIEHFKDRLREVVKNGGDRIANG